MNEKQIEVVNTLYIISWLNNTIDNCIRCNQLQAALKYKQQLQIEKQRLAKLA